MAIFSRRSLQQMIDSNSQVLSEDQLRKHVDGLNRANKQSLDFEWEVAVIYGLSKLGNIRHEIGLAISKKSRLLDILFNSQRPEPVEFSGDIVTVSDRGLHEENPRDAFITEPRRRIQKIGIPLQFFSYKINGKYDGPYGDRKMRLLLPTRNNIRDFFQKNRFQDFLNEVIRFPDREHSFDEKTEQVDIQIQYVPGQQFFLGSFHPYTNVTSITRNPLFNALNRKAQQLKESGYHGYKIVFACDGGSNSLQRLVTKGHGSKGSMSVINKILRDHSSINLVVAIGIDRRDMAPFSYGMGRPTLHLRSFENPRHKCPETQLINELLYKLIDLIPPPCNDIVNSVHHLQSKEKRVGRSFKGGWRMTSKEVRFSARAIQELLAGHLTQEEFFKLHGMIERQGTKVICNPFEIALAEGRLIESTAVEKNSDKDDNWLIFRFGDPDPAIFRFRVPGTS